MIDALFWLLLGVPYVVGGPFVAKNAIARAEKHYLEASREANRKDASVRVQDKMDPDDWVGAVVYASAAFACTPIILTALVLRPPARVVAKPVKSFMMPPQQKEFDQHVERLTAQKELVLGTAKTLQDVMGWEPKDHPDRIALIESLRDQGQEQLSELMRMSDPSRPSGFDANFLQATKREVKALEAGSDR